MNKITLIASTTMGLESIVTQELKDLGYKNINTMNGKVEYEGEIEDICKSNLWLRCADRIYLKMGEFKATSFEELFEKTKKLPWHEIIPKNGEFPVSWISSVKSKLFSKSDSQAIIKKAIVEKLKLKYKQDYFEEDGSLYRIKVQILKDIVTLSIDTSGEPLHKRGYREKNNEAPIKETLAAALVKLTRWRGDERPLIDPTCGTGTIVIEAAMIAKNIAPGVNRRFVSEKWHIIPEEKWVKERDMAFNKEKYKIESPIFASDIDNETIEIAKRNAKNAGVENLILFETKNLLEIYNYTDSEKGVIISNPPYGDRLEDKSSVERLYRLLGDVCRRFTNWSYYIITSHEGFETFFERKSDKNRKLYNGGLKCYYYQYFPIRQKRRD